MKIIIILFQLWRVQWIQPWYFHGCLLQGSTTDNIQPQIWLHLEHRSCSGITWRRLAATNRSSAVSRDSPASPEYTNWMTVSMTDGVTSSSRISVRRDSTRGLVNMALKYGLTAARSTLNRPKRKVVCTYENAFKTIANHMELQKHRKNSIRGPYTCTITACRPSYLKVYL